MKQPSVFDGYNHTELYQTCIDAGIVVRPNEPREAMVRYLEALEEPPPINEANHVFHNWRHGIIGFLNEYWRDIQTQIICPARTMRDPINPNPRPCFGCIDMQVTTCLVTNDEGDTPELIDKHRLVRRPRTT